MKKLDFNQLEKISGNGSGIMYGTCAALTIACLCSVFAAPIAAGITGACIGATLMDEYQKK